MTRLGGHPLLEASNSSVDCNLNSIDLDFDDDMVGSWNRGDAAAETGEFTWSVSLSVDDEGIAASGIIRRESIQVGGLDSRRYNEIHQEPGRQR